MAGKYTCPWFCCLIQCATSLESFVIRLWLHAVNSEYSSEVVGIFLWSTYSRFPVRSTTFSHTINKWRVRGDFATHTNNVSSEVVFTDQHNKGGPYGHQRDAWETAVVTIWVDHNIPISQKEFCQQHLETLRSQLGFSCHVSFPFAFRSVDLVQDEPLLTMQWTPFLGLQVKEAGFL